MPKIHVRRRRRLGKFASSFTSCDQPLYTCECCTFSTKSNFSYQRHLLSKHHLDNIPTPEGLSTASGSTYSTLRENASGVDTIDIIGATCTTDPELPDSEHEGEGEDLEEDLNNVNEFFPYRNKIHFLLCILSSSKTHKVVG